MFNPYSIILGLFTLTGLLTCAWGLRIISNAHKTRQWPCVEGEIEESTIRKEHNDLLPHITYRYEVNNESFLLPLTFPADVTPTLEFAQHYVDKFPKGNQVKVYYNPDNPQHSTLEPGLAQGDWLVLAIGLGMLVIGVSLFLMAG